VASGLVYELPVSPQSAITTPFLSAASIAKSLKMQSRPSSRNSNISESSTDYQSVNNDSTVSSVNSDDENIQDSEE